jgi:hypothetical protein
MIFLHHNYRPPFSRGQSLWFGGKPGGSAGGRIFDWNEIAINIILTEIRTIVLKASQSKRPKLDNRHHILILTP